MTLSFQTHKITTVEQTADNLWIVLARTDDKLFGADIRLEISFPMLHINSAEISVRRDDLGSIPDLSAEFERLKGVRVGPGMTQIVRGILGEAPGTAKIADAVLEAMEMLINALTVPELKKASLEGGAEGPSVDVFPDAGLNDVLIGPDMIEVLGANPRLKNSCAAFKEC
jgi:hypothetical protein